MIIDDSAKIRVIRAMLGLESREFAALLGISAGTMTSWEKGRSTPQREKRKVITEICQKYRIGFMPSGMPVPIDDIMPPIPSMED